MIMTPEMFNLDLKIKQLEWLHKCEPGDYLIKFDLDELKQRYTRLSRIEKLGLKVLKGGKHSSNPFTEKDRQIS